MEELILFFSEEIKSEYSYVFEDLDDDDVVQLIDMTEGMPWQEIYETVTEYMFKEKIVKEEE